ncbi:MAG TPA: exopolysaccharide biosynthesis polyprenyl glycosylphosphotransferase [Flavobacterium sp.]|nr:exopolysaccharide biosynthesis polyprenyl glycosylphosphotransferase [Flavobacterium sp.]
MVKKSVGRYSKYLRPITIVADVLLLLFWINYFLSNYSDNIFILFLPTVLAWTIISVYNKYYEVYRYTKLLQIARKLFAQFLLLGLFVFAYFGILDNVPQKQTFWFLCSALVCIGLVKYGIFLSLKVFRKRFKGNRRNVIIIGKDTLSNELATMFNYQKEYGYNLVKQIENIDNYSNFQAYIKKQKPDEIYLSLKDMSSKQIHEAILFCDNNFINLKYIPSKKEILSNPSKVEYYGYIPIIPEHRTPLELYPNKFIKRTFDILFSLTIIIFVMSWMFPIIAIIIKLESKGPVFFKQKRNGLYFEEFECYKFRSMVVNDDADVLQAQKNDARITRFGKFLRKTSIDEMPQFFNVLLGDMSVCGPRPHMLTFTNQYAGDIDRYKVRHFVKPGITGMAQTHGYRGEIECKRDIVNRIKYDLFYIENWSLLLDLKIIFLTVKNALMGDKKAY